MIQKLNQSVAYICPECSMVTERKLNIFDFSGIKSFELLCGDKKCKKCIGCISEYHDKYKISLSCPFCGDRHDFTINKSSFWQRDYFAFKCNQTNFDLFFIGNSDNIKKAVKQQEEMFSDMEEDFAEDVPLLYEILLRLQEMQEDGLIVCSCGSTNIIPEPVSNGIMLVCGKCGAKKLIPTTEEEYDILLATEFIELKK